jgi:hypothetical protein
MSYDNKTNITTTAAKAEYASNERLMATIGLTMSTCYFLQGIALLMASLLW